MINETDIEAFREDCVTLDKAIDRAKAGATKFRHMRANEELPVLRAAYFWREQAAYLAEVVRAFQAAGEASMACFPEHSKYHADE